MKIALYARVSKGKYQDPAIQVTALQTWAANNSARYTILPEVYIDEISSRKTRPQKEAVLRKLRLGEIQGVAFFALDRWGRTSSELINELEEAVKNKWTIISLKEAIDLSTASGQLFAQMLAVFANFERERIRERINAAYDNAKSKGRAWGRKPREFDEIKARQLRAAGKSWRQIAQNIKVPQATIRARLNAVQELPPVNNPAIPSANGGVAQADDCCTEVNA